MPKRSKDVDAYIAGAAPFARPILERVREAFHAAHPEITETLKWSMPHFEYKGILGSMAAFKQHVSWGFRKAELMNDPDSILRQSDSGMHGSRVTDVSQLPPKRVIAAYVCEAIRLNEEGVKLQKRPARADPDIEVPEELDAALKKNAQARAAFEGFPPSARRDYVEWIAEAKQESTRARRIATAIEWLSEGKSRNWKYEKR